MENLVCGSLRELGLVTSVFLILQYLQAHVKFNIQREKGIWGDREKEGSVEYLQGHILFWFTWAYITDTWLMLFTRQPGNTA